MRYFGLICKRCNEGYPIMPESEWTKPGSTPEFRNNLGPYHLSCRKCGIIERHEDLNVLETEGVFTKAELAEASTRITACLDQRR